MTYLPLRNFTVEVLRDGGRFSSGFHVCGEYECNTLRLYKNLFDMRRGLCEDRLHEAVERGCPTLNKDRQGGGAMMNLTRWNPFEELNSLHRDLDRVFGSHPR